jgi:hypothetical protein
MCMQSNVSTYISKSVVPKILCLHTDVDYRKNLIPKILCLHTDVDYRKNLIKSPKLAI